MQWLDNQASFHFRVEISSNVAPAPSRKSCFPAGLPSGLQNSTSGMDLTLTLTQFDTAKILDNGRLSFIVLENLAKA